MDIKNIYNYNAFYDQKNNNHIQQQPNEEQTDWIDCIEKTGVFPGNKGDDIVDDEITRQIAVKRCDPTRTGWSHNYIKGNGQHPTVKLQNITSNKINNNNNNVIFILLLSLLIYIIISYNQ